MLMSEKKQDYLKKLKKISLKNKIPIIQDDTLLFLKKFIKRNKIINILEIGTAIGYSALGMSNENNQIDTIERDYNKYKLALDFFHEGVFNIKFIWAEAFFYQATQKYDLVFIDASKSQYEKIFQKYSVFLNDNGFIICDNLNFHNLNVDDPNLSRSTKRLIVKLNEFMTFLKNNNSFKTLFLNIGDGLSVSQKINKK
ncbi:O-methyltransferase ['Camptotheca acuminata' phytoplasma]|uniref:O-methyltransferase n=1 Tax='Camptotheca acuminata' phytoplasma TaxID=3239192 RepID=UPI00351A228E